MAYDPRMYNPYNSQQYQPSIPYQSRQYQPAFQQQQPVNGLIKVKGIEGAQMYQMPPGSVSPPLFLEDENSFFVKTTDDGGAATIRKYKFEEEPMASTGSGEFVTREYFDQQMNNILEAINGKHTVPGRQPASQEQPVV